MPLSSFNTPILLLIFNRPATTRRVFEVIRQQKPRYLYVAADGPRPGREDDILNCAAARDIIKTDWDCELHTLYQEENLGCGKGPANAISWFFQNVEQGIVLEDDSIPHSNFFLYAEELLIKYMDNPKIFTIGSSNFQNEKQGDGSYYFSMQNRPFVTWATWRRTWEYFDYYIHDISLDDFNLSLQQYKISKKEVTYWNEIFSLIKQDRLNETSWDYQLMFIIWKNNGYGIVPNVNLSSNIGFGIDATHTTDSGHIGANRHMQAILPLVHPSKITLNRKADLYFHKVYIQPYEYHLQGLMRLPFRINKQIKGLLGIKGSWLKKTKYPLQ